jgi:predicted  nucleic acid-binding Zn-ribbon protein
VDANHEESLQELGWWFRGWGHATKALKIYNTTPDDLMSICSECGEELFNDIDNDLCPDCKNRGRDNWMEDR